MNLADILWVGLAGGVGAGARFVTDGSVRGRFLMVLPVGTMIINVLGSLLLGVLSGLVMFHHVSSDVTLVLGTGFCGGFTTFSTYSFETVRLLQQGDYREAFVNGVGTLVGALTGVGIGLALAYL